jgi:catechol 2,3-dioxygenase-like lactoylglutathione lyase family enzyme
MSIRRIVPNIQSEAPQQSQSFYVDVLGLQLAMDIGWIVTFVSPANPTSQVSVISKDPSGLHPDISLEVDDVDSVYARAMDQNVEIVYPLTDEAWGVRRFFARDPNGRIINIVSHLPPV